MGKKLIVANWKSNKTPSEALTWLAQLAQLYETSPLEKTDFEVVICPPFIDLVPLQRELANSKFSFPLFLGSQNISPFTDGSYTGEVSGHQISSLVNFTLVGHSERRRFFSETNEQITQKLALAVAENIKPILCAQNREEIPSEIKNYPADKLLIMFEPSAAISQGGVYKAENSDTVKETLIEWRSAFGSYPFLYGGSVNGANTRSLLQAGADGFVVGHASLEAKTFWEILQNV